MQLTGQFFAASMLQLRFSPMSVFMQRALLPSITQFSGQMAAHEPQPMQVGTSCSILYFGNIITSYFEFFLNLKLLLDLK